MIYYKGKGEHSVNQLEQMLEECKEREHLINSKQLHHTSKLIDLMVISRINSGRIFHQYKIEEAKEEIANRFEEEEYLVKQYLKEVYQIELK